MTGYSSVLRGKRSHALVAIAAHHPPHSVLVADLLQLPHAARGFDFAISIAVVHHLSTAERRSEAVRAILETLGARGRALIYVWALEQAGSRRGWAEGDEQDVMVPWVTRGKKTADDGGGGSEKTFHRYYHLYRQGELEQTVVAAGGEVVEAGYEKDNWWVVAKRRSCGEVL